MKSDKIVAVSKKLIDHKRGFAAIRYLFFGIQEDPTDGRLYLCLADALKQSVEFEIALKIYQKALKLAQKQENQVLIDEITTKIDNVFILSSVDAPKGTQIGFFIRSLMKMLNTLGKKDWF